MTGIQIVTPLTIDRLIHQRNQLERALMDLVELCDDGPDLSQVGPDPVVLVRAKRTLETFDGPEAQAAQTGSFERAEENTPEPPAAA